MAKKTKASKPSKGKRASEEAVRAALSILEQMSKSEKEVHVMVIGPLFTVTFEAAIEKHSVEGIYTLSTDKFDMNVAPSLAETLLFHPGSLV